MSMKNILAATVVLAVAGIAGLGAWAWSGAYDVGADEPHSAPVYSALAYVRDRSVKARARRIEVPDLADAERIRQGAGNYDSMCKGCHLAPGMAGTELSAGLYPAPPALAESAVEPARAFWVIKHGIKASGMPAWGGSMPDEYIWGMVAFLQALPGMSAAKYAESVAASDGHSHGGGEATGDHAHDGPAAKKNVHLHADGKEHVH